MKSTGELRNLCQDYGYHLSIDRNARSNRASPFGPNSLLVDTPNSQTQFSSGAFIFVPAVKSRRSEKWGLGSPHDSEYARTFLTRADSQCSPVGHPGELVPMGGAL